MVEGRLAREAARMQVIIETRQYAKRQRTWFRHQLAGADVTRLDPRAPDAMERALRWWHEPNEA
jgi:tRNA dimethylallyltransferase